VASGVGPGASESDLPGLRARRADRRGNPGRPWECCTVLPNGRSRVLAGGGPGPVKQLAAARNRGAGRRQADLNDGGPLCWVACHAPGPARGTGFAPGPTKTVSRTDAVDRRERALVWKRYYNRLYRSESLGP